jgi:dienelactone hydrolase
MQIDRTSIESLHARTARRLRRKKRCCRGHIITIGYVLALLTGFCIPFLACADSTSTGNPGAQSNVLFTEYDPLSSSAELVKRLLSPLYALAVEQEARGKGQDLGTQAIDLAKEKFALYVPSHAPTHGFSLLVFIPPWSEARVPAQWTSTLERHGTIFVSAANSGNDANVLDRREPLALLAAINVMRRYPVDAQQVFVGGFSGGARVALRLALGYPDVFRGALLNSGSDAIGNAEMPLPPAYLFRQFQDSARIVYVTGEHDDLRLAEDARSRKTMEEVCVFGVDTRTMPGRSHELADSTALNRALTALLAPAPVEVKSSGECRARLETDVTAQLNHVEDLFASGALSEARRLLEKIDVRYGGLAAPRSVELMNQSFQVH